MDVGYAMKLVYEAEAAMLDPVEEDLLPEAWQVLVDSGAIYAMPGRYGRWAEGLIDQGLIEPPPIG